MKLKQVVVLLLAALLVFSVVGCNSTPAIETNSDIPVAPWEDGGKEPTEYTYAEFEALHPAHQIAFQEWFGDLDEFDEWLQKATFVKEENPWDGGGKKPSEYTYEEFEALTPGQQIAFQNSFESVDDFAQWLQSVQPQ